MNLNELSREMSKTLLSNPIILSLFIIGILSITIAIIKKIKNLKCKD